MVRMKILILVMAVILLGCNEECETDTTRCDGNQAQVCNSKGDWETMDDCTAVSEGTPFVFECQFEDDQHVCVPTNIPVGDGGDGG